MCINLFQTDLKSFLSDTRHEPLTFISKAHCIQTRAEYLCCHIAARVDSCHRPPVANRAGHRAHRLSRLEFGYADRSSLAGIPTRCDKPTKFICRLVHIKFNYVTSWLTTAIRAMFWCINLQHYIHMIFLKMCKVCCFKAAVNDCKTTWALIQKKYKWNVRKQYSIANWLEHESTTTSTHFRSYKWIRFVWKTYSNFERIYAMDLKNLIVKGN